MEPNSCRKMTPLKLKRDGILLAQLWREKFIVLFRKTMILEKDEVVMVG